MKIYFTDFFEVNTDALNDYETFNISLINDLPLFIDPFLVFCSEKEEYQKLHDQIINYMLFLRDEAQKYTELTKGMIGAWYKFSEVKQTYLGFCENSNNGRGLGTEFAIALHSGLKDIFKNFGKENITQSTHIEKLCLIKPNVGRDNISDFVTNLIKEYLLSYTENFAKKFINGRYCKEFVVPKVKFDYEKKIWVAKKYYLPENNNDYVLLTPIDMLVREDTWINRTELYIKLQNVTIGIDNEALRFQINEYFIRQLSSKSKRDERIIAAQRTVEKYPELIDYYIKAKEEQQEDALYNGLTEVTEVKQVFINQIKDLVNCLKETTEFYKNKLNSYDEAMKRVLYLKQVIECCDGYRWFYDGDKPIRREADLHIMFKLVCYDTFADLNSEVNNGRGPVDFKASNGRKDTTLIEFKLTCTLKKNLEKQVEIYKDANDTNKAIKVILFFTDDEYKKTNDILNELQLTGKPGIVLIDARKNKVQASKA